MITIPNQDSLSIDILGKKSIQNPGTVNAPKQLWPKKR
jgi:hypothetical protein